MFNNLGAGGIDGYLSNAFCIAQELAEGKRFLLELMFLGVT